MRPRNYLFPTPALLRNGRRHSSCDSGVFFAAASHFSRYGTVARGSHSLFPRSHHLRTPSHRGCSVLFVRFPHFVPLALSTGHCQRFRSKANLEEGSPRCDNGRDLFRGLRRDSTYVALCFIVIGALYALDLIRQRRWIDLAALLASGVVAVLCSLQFLRELASPTQALTSGHHKVLEFALRNGREEEHSGGPHQP